MTGWAPEVVLPLSEVDDMEEAWFMEALDRITLPFPWEQRRVAYCENRPGHFYFLDPRSERTTWKDPRFLPKGWEQKIDPRGQVYFQYHFTRQTTTIDPRGCPVAWEMRISDEGEIYFAFRPAMRTTRCDPRGLPENVEPALDQLGRMYFKLHDSQSTTWEDPRAGQPEVTLKLWRQAQRKRWWKEKVRREVEEMTRLKELKDMSKVDMEIMMFDKEPSESSVLRRLELALRHSEAFGFDHLQNLHLLWSALEEARVSVLARAAMELKPEATH
eukprot:s269_g6.t1